MTPDLEQDKDAHAPHSPHSYSLNTVPGVPSRAIRQEKKVKGIQIGKEEEQVSLFADNIILHVENPKDLTKKLLKTNRVNLQHTKPMCKIHHIPIQ